MYLDERTLPMYLQKDIKALVEGKKTTHLYWIVYGVKYMALSIQLNMIEKFL